MVDSPAPRAKPERHSAVSLASIERAAIVAALRQHGTARAAAMALGIGRATIHRKMRLYAIGADER